MRRATMPKATIDKNCQAFTPENEIRVARDGRVPTPAFYAGSLQNGDELQFSFTVPLRSNCRHDLGTFRF
jgi:hypothetical protein